MSAVLLVTFVMMGLGQSAEPIRSQAELVGLLSRASWDECAEATHAASRLEPAAQSPALRDSLIGQLVRVNSIIRARRVQFEAGVTNLPPFSEEAVACHSGLVANVSRLMDAKALPALIENIGTGLNAMRGIARFGEAAVRSVAVVARAATAPQDPDGVSEVAGALRTLKLILDAAPVQPLSGEALADIGDVARGRLWGSQSGFALGSACALGVATGRSDLRARVEVLSRDTGELAKMGITDARQVDIVQKAARQALGTVRAPLRGTRQDLLRRRHPWCVL